MGFGLSISVTDAESIYDMECQTIRAGGSFTTPIGPFVGLDFSSIDTQNATKSGVGFNAGLCIGPVAEGHYAVDNTQVYGFNIFDALLELTKPVMLRNR